MKALKWLGYAVAGFFTLVFGSAILFPPDPQLNEQKGACAKTSATVDSEIWSPIACDLMTYKTMTQSECAKSHENLFDRLACYVPTESEYAKKKRENAANNDFERAKRLISERLTDPASAQFRRFLHTGRENKIVCGEVNARNRLGGYNGFKVFLVSFATTPASVILQGDAGNNGILLEVVCSPEIARKAPK